jgi:hypothetical protein
MLSPRRLCREAVGPCVDSTVCAMCLYSRQTAVSLAVSKCSNEAGQHLQHGDMSRSTVGLLLIADTVHTCKAIVSGIKTSIQEFSGSHGGDCEIHGVVTSYTLVHVLQIHLIYTSSGGGTTE